MKTLDHKWYIKFNYAKNTFLQKFLKTKSHFHYEKNEFKKDCNKVFDKNTRNMKLL